MPHRELIDLLSDPSYEEAVLIATGKLEGDVRAAFILEVAKVNLPLAMRCVKSISDDSTDPLLLGFESTDVETNQSE